MLIGDQDFFPGVLKSGFFVTKPAALPVASALATERCARSAVEVRQVAKAALPNISLGGAASKMGRRTSGEPSRPGHQVVRVCSAVALPEIPPVMRGNPWS
jgi:hypothetical protein